MFSLLILLLISVGFNILSLYYFFKHFRSRIFGGKNSKSKDVKAKKDPVEEWINSDTKIN